MANAVTRVSDGGNYSHLYFTNAASDYGANNRALFHYGQADNTPFTSSVSFGTNTSARWILCKPNVNNNTTPTQTALPVGVAAQDFGWNVSSEYLDAYAVLDEATDSFKGRVHMCKPTVISSPRGAAFGNAFDFALGAGMTGVGGDDYAGVNFGAALGPGAGAAFSIDVSFRRDRTGFTEVLAGWFDGVLANGGIALYLSSSTGRLVGSVVNTAGSLVTIETGSSVSTATSHTARLVYDGTTLYLFFNGTLVASVAVATRAIASSVEFWIARYQDKAAAFPFDGAIDEVRVSNTARSTGASYTVDTTPFASDANTTLLCSFESLKPIRRVLKAGTNFQANIYFTASTIDTSGQFQLAMNLYKRSAAGSYTFICGDESSLEQAPASMTTFLSLPVVSSDVIFETGDTLHIEVWVRGRGGGLTGLLSQVITVTYGDPPDPIGETFEDALLVQLGTTPANAGFRYLWDSEATGSIASSSVLQKNYVKYFTGLFTLAKVTGSITKIPIKYFTGLFSEVNLSGSHLKLVSKFYIALIASQGTLSKRVNKPFTGSANAPTGTLVKLVKKSLSGNITPASTLTKLVFKPFTSAISVITGLLKKTPNKYFVGSISGIVGSIIKTPVKRFTANITPTPGDLVRLVYRFFTGNITPVGSVTKLAYRFFTGSAGTPSGALRKVPNKYFTGSGGTPTSTMVKALVKYFTGSVASVGEKTLLVSKYFVGTITSSSATIKFTIVKYFTGFLYGPAGSGGAITITKWRKKYIPMGD